MASLFFALRSLRNEPETEILTFLLSSAFTGTRDPWVSKDGNYKLGGYTVASAFSGFCDAVPNKIGLTVHEYMHTLGKIFGWLILLSVSAFFALQSADEFRLTRQGWRICTMERILQ